MIPLVSASHLQESEDGKTYFLKVHAPWEVLATYAEVLKIKVPFKQNDIPNSREIPLQWLFKPFRLPDEVMNPEPDYFTSPFEKDKPDFFLIDNKDTFFPPSTRNRIVYYILSRCPYWKEDMRDKKGIKRLLSNGTYTSAYALHDCRYWIPAKDPNCESERFTLYKEWARFLCFYKEQPLNLIRKYYGEKIGIYFTWLGFYTKMLFFAAIVGLICFCYGASTYHENVWSREICDPEIGGKIIMCPLCDKKCGYWKLNTTCESSWQSHLFDNVGTLFFAIFMGIWVTMFLEFWKRRQARLEYEWDLVDFEEEHQQLQLRPEYETKCTRRKLNPITQVPRHPTAAAPGTLYHLFLRSSPALVWSAINMVHLEQLGFRALLRGPKDNLPATGADPEPQGHRSALRRVTVFKFPWGLNWLPLETLAPYISSSRVSLHLEIPRTHLEYENRLTMKMFLFQFVNYFSSCFYVAFFKGKFVGYPGKYIYMFDKWRNEEVPGFLSVLGVGVQIFKTY
ncbi:ANO5 protein, partial [Atractosteus spatula]|nr:ANO5 protein [Atractosteus spatula]